jgi:hypothetical protein
MADDATTPTTVTFRRNHLVRLHGFDHAALDGKLVRIESHVDDATGKFEVAFLNDQARPPIPLVPARRMLIKPEHFSHACEYCLAVGSAAVDGGRLQMCGRCKTARYCNAECQRADWARNRTALTSLSLEAVMRPCSRPAWLGTTRRCGAWWRRRKQM